MLLLKQIIISRGMYEISSKYTLTFLKTPYSNAKTHYFKEHSNSYPFKKDFTYLTNMLYR